MGRATRTCAFVVRPDHAVEDFVDAEPAVALTKTRRDDGETGRLRDCANEGGLFGRALKLDYQQISGRPIVGSC